MNRLVPISLFFLCSTSAIAGTSGIMPGSMSTIGPTGNYQSLFAATHNPSLAALTIRDSESWRMSYFASIGTNVELGDVNGFVDEVDDLIDILDDPGSSTQSIDEILSRFNDVLVQMGDEGYLKNSINVYFPGFPIYWKPPFLKGTLFSEFSIGTQERLSIIDGELRFNSQNNGFETSTSAYVKTGIETHFSVGYGQKIFDDQSFTRVTGELYAGAKVNVYSLDLSKQVFQLQLLDGTDIQDAVEDAYEKNLRSTTAVGVDVGLSWVADRYNLGFTVANINSPEFEYGGVGVGCEEITEDQIARSNCELTAQFVETTGEIKSQESHKKTALASVDATYFILDSWALSSSVDLASYDDIVGTQNQYFQVSTSFTPNSVFLPSLRLGYQKNLVGSELTTYGLGVSILKSVSLDLAFSPDSITYDGQSAPRKMSFSLSFEESF